MLFAHFDQMQKCSVFTFVQYILSVDDSLEFNFLPNDKILDLSKFKAFADDKIFLTKN